MNNYFNPRFVVKYQIEHQKTSEPIFDYLTDEDGGVIIFDDMNTAEQAAKEKGFNEYSIVKSIGNCFRCNSPLFPSDIEGYTSQCFDCDEDFYSIEQKTYPSQKLC